MTYPARISFSTCLKRFIPTFKQIDYSIHDLVIVYGSMEGDLALTIALGIQNNDLFGIPTD